MNHGDTEDTKSTKNGKSWEEISPELDALVTRVIGAAIEVHRTLGPGFLESVYEAALCFELKSRGLAVVRQVALTVSYKGHDVGEGRLDLLVENMLVVELKSVEKLAPIHTAQTLSYLRATGFRLALLINFNETILKNGLHRIAL